MNPHNIPRFTAGPDLHFAGGEDAPLLFPYANMEVEEERKPGVREATGFISAISHGLPHPVQPKNPGAAHSYATCPCGNPAQLGSSGQAMLNPNAIGKEQL